MALKRVIKKMVGELLIDHGVITREQLEKALQRKKETGKLLGETLIEMGFASEEDVVDAVATQYRIPYLPLKQYEIDKELLKLFPKEFALRYRCMPLDRIGGLVTVAMENPLDEKATGEIEKIIQGRVLCYVSTHSEIIAAIEEHYGKLEKAPKDAAPARSDEGEGIRIYELEENGITGSE